MTISVFTPAPSTVVTALFIIASATSHTLGEDFNYDESQVPDYTLPDVLAPAGEGGKRVSSPGRWRTERRPQVLELFHSQMFGTMPGKPEFVRYEVIEEGTALAGSARRKQVKIVLGDGSDAPSIDLLLYTPAGRSGPHPAFLGLNFGGNHTVADDPEIVLPKSWMRPGRNGVEENRASEKGRGQAAGRWQVAKVLAGGFALATAYYGDIDPDFDDGFTNGVHALYPELQGEAGQPRGDNWTSIGAWAWGLSRALDYLETDGAVDAAKVAVLGHSRLGKTALWAGATDERFALVISNNSGCGGAALSRRRFGETVKRINTSFPHWFCRNFKQYNDNEGALPLDQHMLIALAAPRPVYVASAVEDRWADPRGEFLAAKGAEPVYELFGLGGIPADDWPPVDSPSHGQIGYHLRQGKHDVTAYDWDQYLRFAAQHLR